MTKGVPQFLPNLLLPTFKLDGRSRNRTACCYFSCSSNKQWSLGLLLGCRGFSTNNPYSCLRKKQWIYKQCEYLQPKPFFSEFSQTSKQNWTLLQGQLQVIMTFQHNYSRPFRLSWRPPYIYLHYCCSRCSSKNLLNCLSPFIYYLLQPFNHYNHSQPKAQLLR